MNSNPYYSAEAHGPFELINIGNLELESGGTIADCRLAVATHGHLNAAKDNAILVTTWYSGTSKIMEQVYIGEGRALDPAKYFIVIVNQIGNGLSTSPHNAAAPQAGPAFPRVRIGDDVRAQHRLLTEHFGIHQLQLVVGGSMGAQQTYEWAVRFPDMVKRAAPIAGTAKSTGLFSLLMDTMEDAITSDPGFRSGAYEAPAEVAAGLKRHAKIWTVAGLSGDYFRAGKQAALGFESAASFADGFLTPYFAPMDPNNLLAMAWKARHADVGRHSSGDLATALTRVTAKTFVMPISHDALFPPGDCELEQRLIANSEFRPLASVDGHLALFGTDPQFLAQLDEHLKDLLATVV